MKLRAILLAALCTILLGGVGYGIAAVTTQDAVVPSETFTGAGGREIVVPGRTVQVTVTTPDPVTVTQTITQTVTTTEPPPPPPASGFLGTSSHGLSSATMAHFKDASGATWYRDDALWGSVETSRGVYNWSRLDGMFANAANAGVNVLLIIDYGGFPGWSAQDYANFAVKVAQRYDGFGGELAFELWNEPYMPQSYVAPTTYANLVRAAATAVRNLGLGIKVGANVDLRDYKANGAPYFANVLNADPNLDDVLDFWSTHPYAGNCAPAATDATCPALGQDWRFDRVPKMQSLAASRGAALPWWLTEFGWSTNTSGVSEATQAQYTVDAIKLARDTWGVEKMFIYTGDCDYASPTTDDREGHFGMRRYSTCTDKPVVTAVKGA